jgi:hypothetical protein
MVIIMPTHQYTNYPQVRINQMAKEHARQIVEELKRRGNTSESLTSWISNLIISQPLPNGNGNGHAPDQVPTNHEEENNI